MNAAIAKPPHAQKTPLVPADKPHWRQDLLTALLGVELLFGTLACVPGVYLALKAGLLAIAVFDGIALALIAYLWRAKHMSHTLRASLSMLVFAGVGFFFLIRAGTYGLLFLSSVPILTALLLGLLPAAITLVGISGGVLAIGIGMALPMSLRFGLIEEGSLPQHWSMLSLNFLLVTAVVTVSTAILLRNMERAMLSASEAQDELRKLALFDVLTGLPNRRMLTDRIAYSIDASARSGRYGALLFIDLDHFKNINDTRGHGVGDLYLKCVADRLSAQVRATDTLGRLGGDEFLVLLPDLGASASGAAQAAGRMAEQIRQVMEQPIELAGATYPSSASIGLSIYPRLDVSADDLMREADTAMYRAKGLGRNRTTFFEDAMQTELQTRMMFEQDLAQALEKHQLWIAVQTQCDPSGRPVGAEFLLRWKHPVRGNISPAEFIPVAEHSGLIVPMGRWVLAQACATSALLRRLGYDFAVSVNISPRQFHQAGFSEDVKGALTTHGALATDLILEVTESLLIKDMDDTVIRMRELAGLGIRFSIDDFGTGYSSLSYLKRLPLSELKIDKSFVDDACTDANDAAIVRMILSMATELNLNVVAEGVETQEQVDLLVAQGCRHLQGYFYARPVAIDTWLADLRARVSPNTLAVEAIR